LTLLYAPANPFRIKTHDLAVVRLASSLIGAASPVLWIAVGSTNGLNIAEADKNSGTSSSQGRTPFAHEGPPSLGQDK
jgi:hypothetical protein